MLFTSYCLHERLNEKLCSLTEMLSTKERACDEAILVLKRKTAQWAKIKAQLSKYKSLRSLFPADTSFTEGESMDVVDESTQSQLSESDQTQLIPPTVMDKVVASNSRDGTSCSNTQLDCLIDLVDENQEEAAETDIDDAANNHSDATKKDASKSTIPSSFSPLLGVTKRKGHKRGCPCCDKVRRTKDFSWPLHSINLIFVQFFQATRPQQSGFRNYLQEAYDRVDSYDQDDVTSTPPGFWDVNFTPTV